MFASTLEKEVFFDHRGRWNCEEDSAGRSPDTTHVNHDAICAQQLFCQKAARGEGKHQDFGGCRARTAATAATAAKQDAGGSGTAPPQSGSAFAQDQQEQAGGKEGRSSSGKDQEERCCCGRGGGRTSGKHEH